MTAIRRFSEAGRLWIWRPRMAEMKSPTYSTYVGSVVWKSFTPVTQDECCRTIWLFGKTTWPRFEICCTSTVQAFCLLWNPYIQYGPNSPDCLCLLRAHPVLSRPCGWPLGHGVRLFSMKLGIAHLGTFRPSKVSTVRYQSGWEFLWCNTYLPGIHTTILKWQTYPRIR